MVHKVPRGNIRVNLALSAVDAAKPEWHWYLEHINVKVLGKRVRDRSIFSENNLL